MRRLCLSPARWRHRRPIFSEPCIALFDVCILLATAVNTGIVSDSEPVSVSFTFIKNALNELITFCILCSLRVLLGVSGICLHNGRQNTAYGQVVNVNKGRRAVIQERHGIITATAKCRPVSHGLENEKGSL